MNDELNEDYNKKTNKCAKGKGNAKTVLDDLEVGKRAQKKG